MPVGSVSGEGCFLVHRLSFCYNVKWWKQAGSFLGPHCVVVQSLGCVQLFVAPWTTAQQARLSFTIPWSLLKFTSTASVMPSNHLILCFHLLLLPSIFPRIRVYSSESILCIKYWSFRFSISPSNEHSGLISFRIDGFDLFGAHLTLKSLLQHTVQEHQLFSAQSSLWSNSHIYTWFLENHSFDYTHLCQQSEVSAF